jgi:hypothetical protein
VSRFTQENKLENIKNTVEIKSHLDRGSITYSKDPDAEFLQLISKTSQEKIKNLEFENQEIRECLRMLQKEMLQIVEIKQSNFKKRFEILYHKEPELADLNLKQVIKPIEEDKFNVSFAKEGKVIMNQF